MFESIDEEDARVCAATSSAASGTSTPAQTPSSAVSYEYPALSADQRGGSNANASQVGGGGSAGWLAWMWGSSSSSSGPPSSASSQDGDRQEKPNYRASCVAAMSRPLTVREDIVGSRVLPMGRGFVRSRAPLSPAEESWTIPDASWPLFLRR